MSFAINVRNIEANSTIGTPLSSENSNTVIGLLKRVCNLLSSFVNRITTRIEAVESAVGSLGPGIGSIETTIQNINSNITNLESSIQTTNSNITSNTNRITTVENTVGNIGPRVSSLETAVQNTNSNVTNLESSIQTINSNVNSNANRISALESTDNQIGGQIASLENATSLNSSNINDLQTNINTLNSTVSTNSSNISSLQSAVNELATDNSINSTNITQIQADLNKYAYYCSRSDLTAFSIYTIGNVHFSFWNTSTNNLSASKTYSVPMEMKYIRGSTPEYWESNNNTKYYPYSFSFKIAFGNVNVANPYTFLDYIAIKTLNPNTGTIIFREFRILPYYNTNLGSDYYGYLPAVTLKRGELYRCVQSRFSNYKGFNRFWIRDVNDYNFSPNSADVLQIIDGEFWSDTAPNIFISQTILSTI